MGATIKHGVGVDRCRRCSEISLAQSRAGAHPDILCLDFRNNSMIYRAAGVDQYAGAIDGPASPVAVVNKSPQNSGWFLGNDGDDHYLTMIGNAPSWWQATQMAGFILLDDTTGDDTAVKQIVTCQDPADGPGRFQWRYTHKVGPGGTQQIKDENSTINWGQSGPVNTPTITRRAIAWSQYLNAVAEPDVYGFIGIELGATDRVHNYGTSPNLATNFDDLYIGVNQSLGSPLDCIVEQLILMKSRTNDGHKKSNGGTLEFWRWEGDATNHPAAAAVSAPFLANQIPDLP